MQSEEKDQIRCLALRLPTCLPLHRPVEGCTSSHGKVALGGGEKVYAPEAHLQSWSLNG